MRPIWLQFVFRSELSFLVKSFLLFRESRAVGRGMAEMFESDVYRKTSDEFFSHRNNRKTFDVKK